MTAFQHSTRLTLLACGAWALGLATAVAQDSAPLPGAETRMVNFTDPAAPLTVANAPSVGVSLEQGATARFSGLGPSGEDANAVPAPGAYEFAVTANGPLDLSIAQRGRFADDQSREFDRRGRGSEVRVGQGLSQQDRNDRDDGGSSWYAFVASDDEALTWNPGSRNEFGGRGASFSLEDRVEIGDLQAGVTYETNGIQASIAYVERDVSATVGRQSRSREENFAGVTLTMRR